MAAAAYRHLARQMELADLLTQAELVRAAMDTPGWRFIADSIAEHRQKMLAQLLNETTRPEEIPRLRGLVNGLDAMQEAAQSVLDLAQERLAAADQETAHAR
jgi:hypothetical protein